MSSRESPSSQLPETAHLPANTLPPESFRCTETFLSQERAKLALSGLSELRVRRERATAILLPVAAYIAIATVGFAESEHLRDTSLSKAFKIFEETAQELESATLSEEKAFSEHTVAAEEVTYIEGQLAMMDGNKKLSSAKRIAALRKARLARKQTEIERQRTTNRTRNRTKKARTELREAESRIAEFKRNDRDRRPSWDRLRAPIPTNLTQKRDTAKVALKTAEGEARDPLPITVSQKVSSPKRSAPSSNALRLVELQGDLAKARTRGLRKEHRWWRTKRTEALAQSAHAESKSARDKLAGKTHPPLKLPVIGLPVSPQLFFLSSPLLLSLLLIHLLRIERLSSLARERFLRQVQDFLQNEQEVEGQCTRTSCSDIEEELKSVMPRLRYTPGSLRALMIGLIPMAVVLGIFIWIWRYNRPEDMSGLWLGAGATIVGFVGWALEVPIGRFRKAAR